MGMRGVETLLVLNYVLRGWSLSQVLVTKAVVSVVGDLTGKIGLSHCWVSSLAAGNFLLINQRE